MAANTELKGHLAVACEDLWWSSEADYPVEVVWEPNAELPTQPLSTTATDRVQTESPERYKVLRNKVLRNKVLRILQADGLAVERESALTEVDVDAFFKRSLIPKSWHTTEDKAQLAQLQQLKVLLTESLQHLRVYRYGEVDISVYILGVTPEGKIAGVKTRLVET